MRRREVPAAAFGHEEPPPELLRFQPSEPPPTTPDGRPMPWAVKWSADDFAAFLRARAAWRDAHNEPLPGLSARDRCAMAGMDIPRALVEAERSANKSQFPARTAIAAPVHSPKKEQR